MIKQWCSSIVQPREIVQKTRNNTEPWHTPSNSRSCWVFDVVKLPRLLPWRNLSWALRFSVPHDADRYKVSCYFVVMINMTVRDERCWGVLPLHMRREREREHLRKQSKLGNGGWVHRVWLLFAYLGGCCHVDECFTQLELPHCNNM